MAEALTPQSFVAALVGELSTAIEAIVGETVSTAATTTAPAEAWRIILTASGEMQGGIEVCVDQAGSATLAKRVMGFDEEPDAATIADMLRELWSQAAGSLSLIAPFTGVTVSVGTAELKAAKSNLAAYELRIGAEVVGAIAIGGELSPPIAVVEHAPVVAETATIPQSKLDVVLDIDLPLVVRFGRTFMSLKALSALGPGSIVDMGRSPDEPVQMLVGDQVIARGEVVIVGGNYGVRITDLVSPADRVRALEA